MRRAIYARGILLSLALSTGCGSFQFGKHPALPGSADAVSAQSQTPTPAFTVPEQQRIALVQPWVDEAAFDYELEPHLLNAMIWVESRFVERATSPAGAQGLMQLMPPTAKELAQKLGRSHASSYDPEFNITAGALYLRKMLDRYRGDLTLALAAYNAGPGNVDQWTARGGRLPPRSREYVQLVLDARRRFEEHHDAILIQTDTMLAKAQLPDEPAAEEAPAQYVPDPPPQRPAARRPTPSRQPAGSKPRARRKPSAPNEPPAPDLAPPGSASEARGAKPPSAVGKGALPSILDE